MYESAKGGWWYFRCSKCGYEWYNKKLQQERCVKKSCRTKLWNMDSDIAVPCKKHDWTNTYSNPSGDRFYRTCIRCKLTMDVN